LDKLWQAEAESRDAYERQIGLYEFANTFVRQKRQRGQKQKKMTMVNSQF